MNSKRLFVGLQLVLTLSAVLSSQVVAKSDWPQTRLRVSIGRLYLGESLAQASREHPELRIETKLAFQTAQGTSLESEITSLQIRRSRVASIYGKTLVIGSTRLFAKDSLRQAESILGKSTETFTNHLGEQTYEVHYYPSLELSILATPGGSDMNGGFILGK